MQDQASTKVEFGLRLDSLEESVKESFLHHEKTQESIRELHGNLKVERFFWKIIAPPAGLILFAMGKIGYDEIPAIIKLVEETL